MTTDLPPGWVRTTLGEVVDYGATKKVEPGEIDPDAWVLELEDIEKHTSTLIQRVTFSVRNSKSTKNAFSKGDVLYGKLRPYLNKIIIADNEGFCTTEIVPIKAGDHIDSRYLFYSLKRREFLDYAAEASHGLNMPRLGTKQGRAAPFVLAPLNEQIRIANKLDSLLAKVNAAQKRLELIPTLLKRFRQSVLAAATSGELTREWREENSVDVGNIDFQMIWENEYQRQGKRFKHGKIIGSNELDIEIPESWLSARIGEVCDVYVGATPSRKQPRFWNGDISWVSSSEVAFCRISKTKQTISREGLKNTSTNVHPVGTVMLAMIGQGKTRGQAAILDVEACHNQNTAALRVLPGILLSEYLYYFLWLQYERTRKIGGGNNQQALNKAIVQGLAFPYPPLDEQKEIVRRVESLFALAEIVEQQYNDAKKRIDQLTQSLLAKAFRGELVEQDPNDDPASELITRIQAGCISPRGAKRKRKKVGTA